jgi:hypothetical protein
MAYGTLNAGTITPGSGNTLTINEIVDGTAIKDEDAMGSNSATHLATQQSIKAYVDSAGTNSSITTLGTVTAGNLSNTAIVYPAGHIIASSIIVTEGSAQIESNSATYIDTALESSHTTVATSANSYLRFTFDGSSYMGTDGQTNYIDVTMKDESSTDYDATESIMAVTFPWYMKNQGATGHFPIHLVGYCGLVSGMGMPTAKDEWAIGDVLKFRVFIKSPSNNWFRIALDGSMRTMCVEEVSR